MSAINATGSGLYQFLQSLLVNNQSPATSDATATAATAPATTTTSTAATGTDPSGDGSQVQGSGRHHGKGSGALFQQLQQAVTSALQSAQASGSTTDPNQIIEGAIAKVLQQNGITGSSGTQANGSDPDSDADPTASATDPNSPQQAFLKTLQSYGVDAQQFHKDFLAAVKDAQGGQIDPSSVFQSFPPGTAIDTTG